MFALTRHLWANNVGTQKNVRYDTIYSQHILDVRTIRNNSSFVAIHIIAYDENYTCARMCVCIIHDVQHSDRTVGELLLFAEPKIIRTD